MTPHVDLVIYNGERRVKAVVECVLGDNLEFAAVPDHQSVSLAVADVHVAVDPDRR
jgi:hypothetical protein